MASPLRTHQSFVRRSCLALVAVLCGAVGGLSAASAEPEASRLPSPPKHSTVTEPGITSHDLELSEGWDYPDLDEGSGNRAGSRLVASGVRLDVDDEPEMVIIDTAGQEGHFAVRSRNAGEWSDWVSVEAHAEEGPDAFNASIGAIGPIWVGESTEQIEIVELGAALESIRVETLAASMVPEVSLVASAVIGQPAIQPRSSWTSDGWAFGNEDCDNGPHYADNVRAMVIHHTVTTNSYSQTQVDDLLRGIYRTHVVINGWCDIGYNFVVDRFGTIWEARSGGIDKPVIGGHAKGFNTWSSGVALLGQHQYRASPAAASPSQASLDAIAALASWKLGLHGVDPRGTTWMKSRTNATSGLRYPDGTWVEVPTVLGHRDLGFTSCPGSYTYTRVPSIRAATTRDDTAPRVVDAHTAELSGPAFLTVDSSGALRAGGAAEYPTAAPDPAALPGASAVAVAGFDGRGFVLYDNGRLQSFGGSPTPTGTPAGGNQAVDLLLTPDGSAGYVLDETGRLHGFNGASAPSSSSPLAAPAVAATLTEGGRGYVVDAQGGLHPIGASVDQTLGETVAAVDVGVLPDGAGGWVLDSAGGLHAFGSAPDASRHGAQWNGQARALLVDPNGNGGWILDSEGRIDVFGDERVAAPLATTVGLAVAADATLWWELRPEAAEQDMARYAAALVELFLQRQLDDREIDRYTWKADFAGSSNLAVELANSDEWAGRIVEDNYVGVLGRGPEQVGRDYWVGRLRAGLRTQDLGAMFYSSPEYVAAAGSHEEYVRRLYRALLHREADGPGLSHWVENLSNGRALPIDIATGFYNSIESRNDRVTALYETVLGRGPDDDGLAYWSERLLSQDDIALAIDLATSDEFYGLATG